ncbi:MAG: tetratricopeptide repeat protein [Planctomycetia bacterium]|nr:tetratricopeptide repeat protein [Planctomycetia bacterium]
MHRRVLLAALAVGLMCALLILPSACNGADAEALVKEAREAAANQDYDRAIQLASDAIQANPKFAVAFRLRGSIFATQRKHKEALADFTRLVELEPQNADHYDRRGSALFCLGMVQESIADFDRAIELDRRLEKQHWKRGIAYYYAGEFEKGQKQFEAYQTVDDNDVENAVWRYLCMCGTAGRQRAAAEILKIKNDTRVPMMQVYDLYRGAARPDDVLAAVKRDDPGEDELHQRLFYAHLYLGLYYDASGEKRKALEEMEKADKLVIGHYMWDVAHVHAERLRKDAQGDAKDKPNE